MKFLFFLFVFMVFASCKKDDNGVHCYECDFSSIGNGSPGQYKDAGCMTKEQWSTVIFTDNLGNSQLDKSRYCRRK